MTVYGVVLETRRPRPRLRRRRRERRLGPRPEPPRRQRAGIDALALRGSDLVILNYGTNESTQEGIGGPRYEREYAETIGRVRRALPEASILVMAPMDRGDAAPRREHRDAAVDPAARRRPAPDREGERLRLLRHLRRRWEGRGRWDAGTTSEPRLVTGDFTHTTKRRLRPRREAPRRGAPGRAGGLRGARAGSRPPSPAAKEPAPAVSPRPEGGPPPS